MSILVGSFSFSGAAMKKNDWIKIKNYYIHNSISLEDLAKKFKTSYSAVRKHCYKEKWVEQREVKAAEIEQEVAEKTKQSAVDRKVAANEKHTELFDKGLKVAELLLNQYLAELQEGKKKTKASAYNLDFIMKAIANAQKGQRMSLNIVEGEGETSHEPEIMYIDGITPEDI